MKSRGAPGGDVVTFAGTAQYRRRRTISVYSKYALRRIATPEEVAATAVFLASDASSFVTGAVLVADGGLTSKCY